MVQDVRYRGWSRGAERPARVGSPDLASETELGTIIVAPSLKELVPAEAVWTDRLAVTAAGTRRQLPDLPCRSVAVKALAANLGTVYLGGVYVNAANGFPLAASEVINLAIDNVHRLYLDADNDGDGVAYLVDRG